MYRARDTKLGRDVALKILPEAFANDTERLARFEREAHLLASLNHSHIASIHGLEQSDSIRFLVLEFVEGEDLAQRLRRGPVSVSETIEICREIAEALEEAHEQGVVHRDLKPANIKVDPDGKVKVLDFGLAKALETHASDSSPNLSQSPTLMASGTVEGVILGTAAYMSPEQARGKRVDRRTDVWAFGCVLFEMLTGKKLFYGETLSDTLAAVLRADLQFDDLPSATPPTLRRLLQRCLDRDPRRRLQSIGEARIKLENVLSGDEPESYEPERAPGTRGRAYWAVAGLALGVVITFVGLRSLWMPRQAPPELRRFSIDIPWDAAPNWTDFIATVSPNGSHIAYNCREGNQVSVCVRALNSLTPTALVDARDLDGLFFSPDTEWIAFYDGNNLSRVSIQGGETQLICRFDNNAGKTFSRIQGFSWGNDQYILIGTNLGLYRVAAAGGEVEPVARIDSASTVRGYSFPAHLPGGGKVLVTVVHEDDQRNAGIIDLADGTLHELPLRGFGFDYSPTGHLVFKQENTVLAAAFDTDNPEHVGTPVPMLKNVRHLPSLATDGTLVYIPVRGKSEARLVWVDRAGRPSPIAGERRNYSHLDLSPGGKRVLLDASGTYVLDLDRGTRNLLSQGSFPIWSSDGLRATSLVRGGLVWQPADGSGNVNTLVESNEWLVATSWNPVTGDLAYYSHRSFDISILRANGESFVFQDGPGRKRSGRFSPNGKWLAYVNDDTGEYQVYVTAYPGPGPHIAVSIDGGLSPIWSPDGRELFFRHGGKVMAAEVRYANGIRFGVPVELFDGPYTLDLMGHQRYDVSSDGQSFLMVENSDDFPIIVVQNWDVELKKSVPTTR